jgi:hypothetical protein
MRTFAFSLFASTLVASGLCAQEMAFFTIGSGDVAGGYYETATAICNSINRDGGDEVRCSPDPTAGSIYNLDALRSGQIDFALVQSDWQRQALEGTGRYEAIGPMTDLRSVMGLYPETLTVLARGDSGIQTVDDLVGKRIDIGHPSSGRNATNRQLFEILGFAEERFTRFTEMTVDAAIKELCADRIDATLLIIGHPSSIVGRALSSCQAVMVPVTSPRIDAFVAANDDYLPMSVSAGTYPSLDVPIRTFAVTATMVTRANADPEIVSRLVTTVVEHLLSITQAAPVLSDVSSDDLPIRGLTAPLHPAAAAAYSMPLAK